MPVYPGRPLGARPEGLAAANRLELLMRESKSRVLPLTPSRRVPGECPGPQSIAGVPSFRAASHILALSIVSLLLHGNHLFLLQDLRQIKARAFPQRFMLTFPKGSP